MNLRERCKAGFFLSIEFHKVNETRILSRPVTVLTEICNREATVAAKRVGQI